MSNFSPSFVYYYFICRKEIIVIMVMKELMVVNKSYVKTICHFPETKNSQQSALFHVVHTMFWLGVSLAKSFIFFSSLIWKSNFQFIRFNYYYRYRRIWTKKNRLPTNRFNSLNVTDSVWLMDDLSVTRFFQWWFAKAISIGFVWHANEGHHRQFSWINYQF